VGFTSGRSTSAATPDFVKALRDAFGAIYGLVNNRQLDVEVARGGQRAFVANPGVMLDDVPAPLAIM